MNKVLFSATVDEHILSFHIPYLRWFKENGFEVHVASNGNNEIPYVDIKYNIPFSRSPLETSNLKAFLQLAKIIEQNNYVLIHCHTPVGAALTRLAFLKARTKETKIIYTVHGFHFYKGAPLKNWILYYPIEKWLSKYTDCLITINKEDYDIAINKHFKAKKIKLVHGVGIDLNRFKPQTLDKKIQLRKKYGYNENDFILFYAAELNYNKHQDFLIYVVSILKNKIPNIKLLLAGSGPLEKQYKEQIRELKLVDNVKLLGYRNDIPNLLMLSDVVVASSRREGLPVNIMEAMATGLPLVVTNIRGHRDLVRNGENGYIVELNNVEGFAKSIENLYKDEKLRERFGQKSIELIQQYSLESILKELKMIYIKFLR